MVSELIKIRWNFIKYHQNNRQNLFHDSYILPRHYFQKISIQISRHDWNTVLFLFFSLHQQVPQVSEVAVGRHPKWPLLAREPEQVT